MSVVRVGVWAAVSSKAQAAEDKVSLQDQEQRGQEFAQSLDGGQVVAVYRVGGQSRDIVFWHHAEAAIAAYGELRRDIEAGRLDVLWCYDVDRLGRDPALAQTLISLVETNGAEVYISTAPHPIGQKTAGHRYVSAIQAVRAGEDSALRAYRHASGMRGRVKRGMIANTPPYGYQAMHSDNGDVRAYEFTAGIAAVELMTTLFLSGHSYAEIQRRMNASDYPPPMGGDFWQHKVIRFCIRIFYLNCNIIEFNSCFFFK